MWKFHPLACVSKGNHPPLLTLYVAPPDMPLPRRPIGLVVNSGLGRHVLDDEGVGHHPQPVEWQH